MSSEREPEAVITEEQPRGLECAGCGCRHFFTLQTRKGMNHVRRRRECRNCGRMVTTREVVIKKT